MLLDEGGPMTSLCLRPAAGRGEPGFAEDRAGAETVLVNMNRGAMPQELFLEQIRRFGAAVLPALQAHEVAGVAA
jgi:hypothetical protein